MKIRYIDRKTNEIKYEIPPSEGLLNFLYNNPFGKMAILPLAKRKLITTIYGKRMSKPSSTKKITKFVNTLNIDMSESVKQISEFKSFNDFFYRKLKPNARTIEEGFVSPGDGKLLAFENISDIHHFFIKGRKFTLKEFLNSEQLAKKYETASLLILRLAPNDYHRFHFPYEGIATETKHIDGDYYSVSPYAVLNNFTRVFCENKREFCELKSIDKGNILIAPVGATMVGSIIETYTPNSKILKGEEMGYFKFGGSTVVMLIDKNKLRINEDLIENTKNKLETFVRMGEQIAN